MARNTMLIFVALLTDATQAFLTAGFLGLGGSASGATLGIAAPVAMPLGIAMGFTTAVVTSFTFGSGLLLLLAYNGMFYIPYGIGGSVAELIPGLDVIPGWTIMTILCIVKKSREEGGVLGSVAGAALKVVAPEAAVAMNAASAVASAPQRTAQAPQTQAPAPEPNEAPETSSRVSSNLKNIDGIRQNRAYAA